MSERERGEGEGESVGEEEKFLEADFRISTVYTRISVKGIMLE
jgi:hypothetical protein